MPIANTCPRQQLLNYLRYQCTKQERCCCVCQESSTGDQTAACNEPVERVRFLTTANTIILQKLILNELHQLEADNSSTLNLMLMKSPIPPQNVLKKIMICLISVVSGMKNALSKFSPLYQHMPHCFRHVNNTMPCFHAMFPEICSQKAIKS